jgi:hypothetical protein
LSIGEDVVGYLSTKGIRTFRAAGAEVTAHCFIACQDGDPKGKGKLYVNTETWLYSCKRCGASGGRKALLTHFGDQDKDTLAWTPGTDPAKRRKALTEGVTLAQDMLLENPEVLAYLTGPKRNLTEQTIMDAGIGYAPASWGLGAMLTATNDRRDVVNAGLLTKEGQEFFSGHILIPYKSHDNVVQVRGRAYHPSKTLEGPKYVTPLGDSVRLYNADALLGATRAIVVEGEFDCLALQQALRRSRDPLVQAIAVVGISGSQTLPSGFINYFDACKRVYVGLDPDDPGRIGADKIVELLGSKSRRIDLPDDLPATDWSDYLAPAGVSIHSGHKAEDVCNLMAAADRVGRTLVTPRDAAISLAKTATTGGLQLGFPGLDLHLGSGVLPGQICIPIARTGAGKSALLASIIYNARRHPMLVISLELTAAEFWNRLAKIARFFDPNIGDEELLMLFANIRFYEKRIKPGDVLRLCDEFTEDVGSDPFGVVVDYIGYAAKAYPGANQYERTTRAVLELKEDAKAGSFALLAPHQAGRAAAGGIRVRAEDSKDSGAIEDTADILMSLYRPNEVTTNGGNPQPFDGNVQSELLKNRNGRIGVTVPLLFSMASLVVVQKNGQHARHAQMENDMIMRGDQYPAILQHRRNSSAQQLQLVRAIS